MRHRATTGAPQAPTARRRLPGLTVQAGVPGGRRTRGARPDRPGVLSQEDIKVICPLGTRLLDAQLQGLVGEARALVASGVRKLVIDLRHVRDVDGASIGALVETYRLLRAHRGWLRLSGLHPWVRRMVDLSRIGRVVPIDEALSDALASLRTAGAASFTEASHLPIAAPLAS